MALSVAPAVPWNSYKFSNRISSKKYRGGNYNKLIHRFYEALILLKVLGKTRAPRDVNPGRASTTEERRRRLLRNLSYLCDYEKGGDTTVAIALEEKSDCFTFWLASNRAETANKILTFLRNLLASINTVIHRTGDQRLLLEDELTRACITFAKKRATKEANSLTRAIRNCKSGLDLGNNTEDIDLWNWLKPFSEERNYFNMCFLAYQRRKAPEMRCLGTKIAGAQEAPTPSTRTSDFETIRHVIGRLAHHVRAPKQVLEDFSILDGFLDAYDVRSIPQGDSIKPPMPDGQTELSGIIKRMFPADDPRLQDFEEYLPIMDHRLSLYNRIMLTYNDSNFKPKVHAEIQVLEYFYENRLRFVEEDRFIACSKPACFCCQLYIQHHPLRCVKPEAHYNIWLNWGPPELPGGIKNPRYQHQRDILNRMIPIIREEALDQLRNKAGPLKSHPDSHTGITPSEASELLNNIRLRSMEATFETLSINSVEPDASENEDQRSSSPEYSSASSVRAAGSSSQQGDTSSSDDDSDVEGGGASLG